MAFDLTALLNVRANLTSLRGATRDIQSALNRVNVSGVAGGFGRASRAIEDFGRVSGLAIRRYSGFVVATSITFGFIRAVTRASSEAIKFERQLLKVSQVSDRDVRALGLLTREIDKLSTSFGVSSGSLIEVSQVLAQAGLSATDTRRALRALSLTTLSATFGDITQTTEGAIAAMAQFGFGANSLEKVLGSLNIVAADFAVESADLITAIRNVGSIFQAAGRQAAGGPEQRLNELSALFTSVRATTRLSASTISAGLRTIFTRIQRPRTIEFLETLGIKLTETTAQGEAFVGAFEAIKRINEGLRRQNIQPGTVQFARIAEELAGVRQLKVLIPLLTEFETATEAFNRAQTGTNSLIEDAQVALQGLGQRFDQTRERFLAFIRELIISDDFKRFANTILDLADSFIKLANALRPLLPLLSTIFAIRVLGTLPSFGRGFARGVSQHFSLVPRHLGGPVQRLQGGGPNKLQDVLLTPGELVVLPKEVKKIGVETLDKLNRTEGILKVPGVGDTDSVRQSLPVGSFVLRKKAVDTLKRKHGGPIGFQEGGSVDDFNVSTSGLNLLLTTLIGGLFIFGRGLQDSTRSLDDFRKRAEESIPLSGRQRNIQRQLNRTTFSTFDQLRTEAEATTPPHPRGARGRFISRSAAIDEKIRKLREQEVNRLNSLSRLNAKEELIRQRQITAQAKVLRHQEFLAKTIPRVGLAATLGGAAISGLETKSPTTATVAGGAGGALTGGGIAALLGANPVGIAAVAALGGVAGALTKFQDTIEQQRLTELNLATSDLTSTFEDFQADKIDFEKLNAGITTFLNDLDKSNQETQRRRRPFGLGGTEPKDIRRQAARDELGRINTGLKSLRSVFIDPFRGDPGTFGKGEIFKDELRVAGGNRLIKDVQGTFAELGDQIPNIEAAIAKQFKTGQGVKVSSAALIALGSRDKEARQRVEQRFIRRPDILPQILAEEFEEAGLELAKKFVEGLKLDRTAEQAAQQLDFMSERLRNIGAVAQKAGEQAARFQQRRFRIEQGLETLPQTGQVSTRTSTLLGNLRASSPKELEQSLESIRQITGGGFPDLEQAFKGLDNLRRTFPGILGQATQEPVGARETFLQEALADAAGGGALGDRLRGAVSEIFNRKGQDVSIEEFAKEFDIDQLSQGLSEQLTQTFRSISSEFESAAQSFIDTLDKARALTQSANKSFEAVGDIRSQRFIQQVQLRGGPASRVTTEVERRFLARQRNLTGLNVVDDSPESISREIRDAQSRIRSEESKLNRAVEQGDAEGVVRFSRSLSATQERLGNLNQALQNLATSTERQTAIQNELASLEGRRSARGNFLDEFFGGGAAGRANLLRNVAQGRLLLEGGDISAKGDVAQRQLQGLRDIQNLAQQAGDTETLNRVDETFDRLLGRFAGGGLVQQGLGGLPQRQAELLGQLDSNEFTRQGANEEIGKLRKEQADQLKDTGRVEFEDRTKILESTKLIDESFNKAAAALAASSDKLSQNITAIAEQLANLNIPAEITFNGTINNGQPLVVSLAGQDSLSNQISTEVANNVDKLLRERLNERTIENLFS